MTTGETGTTNMGEQERPTLEMVFVLDTTGSMGGLLEGAKQRIWAIVNETLQSSMPPHIRIGLVAYRDHDDAYITKVLPITNNLDEVYATLMQYQAEGGGDFPEDVRQALADGVHKTNWMPRSPHTAQVLFLVGDAPPHDDYAQEPDTLVSARQAVDMGITVNTIQCGNHPSTTTSWKRIAKAGNGQYFAIAQDGGVQAIPTPYDARLAELGEELGGTYMAYGGSGAEGAAYRLRARASHAGHEMAFSAAAPAAPLADRALNKALHREAYVDDLLQGIENGSLQLDAIAEEALPEELQPLAPEARQAEVSRRLQQRKMTRDEILALAKQREAFVTQEKRKQADAQAEDGFDTTVARTLKEQAAEKGIHW